MNTLIDEVIQIGVDRRRDLAFHFFWRGELYRVRAILHVWGGGERVRPSGLRELHEERYICLLEDGREVFLSVDPLDYRVTLKRFLKRSSWGAPPERVRAYFDFLYAPYSCTPTGA